MPELPEVETVKRGLQQNLIDVRIEKCTIRCSSLRWPIPADLNELLSQKAILSISRRGKYLLFHLSTGSLIVHLGMSGSLRLLNEDRPLKPHDHVDIVLSSGQLLRYNDPRRFGAILWSREDPEQHPLLQNIGIEPLDEAFTGEYLQQSLLKHTLPIKQFVTNSKKIAGIGNIYAAEALFLAKIHPKTPANCLSEKHCEALVAAIKTVLQKAIAEGGTTLKDYVNSEGKPGYFAQQLYVYGRANAPCKLCGATLCGFQLSKRATVFCPHCQPFLGQQ